MPHCWLKLKRPIWTRWDFKLGAYYRHCIVCGWIQSVSPKLGMDQ